MILLRSRLFALWSAIFVAMAAAATAQEISRWDEVVPKAAGFAIRMPGIPAEETDPDTKAKQLEIRIGDRRYFVSYRELTHAERKADPAATLEKLRDAFIATMFNTELLQSASAPLGSAPGLVWTFDAQAANHPPLRIRGRMVLAKGRLYMLIYVDRKFAFEDAAADQWFASFRLVE
jgi:hypothetical protein